MRMLGGLPLLWFPSVHQNYSERRQRMAEAPTTTSPSLTSATRGCLPLRDSWRLALAPSA